MKISGGYLKGRRFTIPRGAHVRPTSARVMKSLFDVIADFIEQASILDLFAGSGAFGIEALSRGANNAAFIDQSRRTITVLKNTLKELSLEHVASLHTMKALSAIEMFHRQKIQFSIIFADPPYESNDLAEIIRSDFLADILTSEGILIVESRALNPEISIPKKFNNIFDRNYGDTEIKIFRHQNF